MSVLCFMSLFIFISIQIYSTQDTGTLTHKGNDIMGVVANVWRAICVKKGSNLPANFTFLPHMACCTGKLSPALRKSNDVLKMLMCLVLNFLLKMILTSAIY